VADNDDWYPYDNQAEFELANFLYQEEQMSAGKINKLSQILAAMYPDNLPTFSDYKDLYNTIDATEVGEVAWESFTVTYNGALPEADVPSWMTAEYEVWHRNVLQVCKNQIGNPDFSSGQDYAAKQVFKGGKQQYCDVMSGDFTWEQSVGFFFLCNTPSL